MSISKKENSPLKNKVIPEIEKTRSTLIKKFK
jgi:hypothetical protein